jgi:hypothetical protein
MLLLEKAQTLTQAQAQEQAQAFVKALSQVLVQE